MKFSEWSRGDVTPPARLHFTWSSGADLPGLFVWTTSINLLVATDALAAFKELSGWASHPVRLTDGNGNEFPGYELFVVRGRCGRFLAEDCIRVHPSSSTASYPERRGFSFAESASPNDFVMPAHLDCDWILINDRAMSAINAMALPNIATTASDQIILPELLYEELIERKSAVGH